MQLISGIDSSGLFATVAQDYLYDNAGTAAREAISALRAKQDALTFNYDNTSITGINGSAIGGVGGGDMYESNLNLDGNYITGYNSSAFKDFTITADLTNLQSVSSTVYTNSATNWQNVITGITIDSTAVSPVNYVVDIPLSGKVDKETGKGLSTNDYVNSAKEVVDLADAVIPTDAAANNQLVSNSTLLSAIANVGSFEIAPLGNNDEPAPTGTISTKTFYLTKPSTAAATDPYTEWIYTSSSPSNTSWNVIGLTEIDLDGYVQFPSTYTADHLVAFGSNDTIYDTGVTINDLAGSITGITLAGGSELGITNKVVNIPGATTASAGIMTSSDKAKLDGIESGANVNVQADWSESDSTDDSYIANKPDIVIPISSNAFAKATQIVVVSAMPSSPDPTTIYLVKEAT